MKRVCLFICTCFLLFGFSQKQTRHKFYIEIYYESNIENITRFILNQDSIKVLDCSNTDWGCKTSKIIYSKKLTKKLSDSIYSILLKNRVDTLKKSYEFINTRELSVYDGLNTHYIFSGDKIKYTKTHTYATSTVATKRLNSFLRGKVIPEKYYYGLTIYGE